MAGLDELRVFGLEQLCRPPVREVTRLIALGCNRLARSRVDQADSIDLDLSALSDKLTYLSLLARMHGKVPPDLTRTTAGCSDSALRLGRQMPTISASIHFGALDLCVPWLRSIRHQHQIAAPVEDLSSERMRRWYDCARAELGIRLLRQGDRPFQELLTCLRRDELICMVLDSSDVQRSITYRCPDGSTIVASTAAAELARRSGAQIVPTVAYFENSGSISVLTAAPTIVGFHDDIEEATFSVVMNLARLRDDAKKLKCPVSARPGLSTLASSGRRDRRSGPET